MTEVNAHFISVAGWEEAEEFLGFEPLRPAMEPRALRVHVKDHRLRDTPPTLEAYFDGFVLSQAERDLDDAARLATKRYGPDRKEVSVSGHPGYAYELGPEPEPDDIDPRSPSVITWADGGRFVFLASEEKNAADLLQIAASLYSAS